MLSALFLHAPPTSPPPPQHDVTCQPAGAALARSTDTLPQSSTSVSISICVRQAVHTRKAKQGGLWCPVVGHLLGQARVGGPCGASDRQQLWPSFYAALGYCCCCNCHWQQQPATCIQQAARTTPRPITTAPARCQEYHHQEAAITAVDVFWSLHLAIQGTNRLCSLDSHALTHCRWQLGFTLHC